MKGKNAGAIKKLQGEIELYDMNIEDDASDANSYYMKGVTLTKISKLSKDDGNEDYSSLQQEALKCLSQAVENDNTNGLYLAERSKLHAEMGNTEAAIEDMRSAQNTGELSGIAGIYLKNTMRDIARLDGVREGVSKLAEKGEISQELAKLLNEHASVTAGLVVTTGAHGEKLDKHDAEIEMLKAMVADLAAGKKTQEEAIAQLRSENASLSSIVTDNTARITAIEEEMTKFVSKDEFESYAAKAEDRLSILDNKIQFIEVELEGQKKTIAHIDDSLRKANVFGEVEVKAELEALKVEYGSEVHEYASKFYWTVSNYLLAHRMLSTGMIEGSAYKGKSGLIGKVSETLADVLGNVVDAVPFVGSAVNIVSGIISSISEAYDEARSDQIVKKVNDSISGSMLEKDLSLAIAKAGILIAKQKADIIQGKIAPEKTKGFFSKAKAKIDTAEEWVSSKIDKVLFKTTKVKETFPTEASKLALEDTILFISWITTTNNKLVNGEGPIELGEKIAHMFTPNGEMERQLESMYKDATKGKSKYLKVNAVTDIIYDNELLNHPELLKDGAKLYGMNKAIDLSSSLSDELIAQAVEYGDAELVLAGMMSVEL